MRTSTTCSACRGSRPRPEPRSVSIRRTACCTITSRSRPSPSGCAPSPCRRPTGTCPTATSCGSEDSRSGFVTPPAIPPAVSCSKGKAWRAAPKCDPNRWGVRAPARIAASSTRWATAPTRPMNHALALALLGVDCLVRAWRIQLAVWTAGGRLSFTDAFRLNLYGEAASQLTPNRLGGEPARFLGLHEARLRPVTAIVAIGVEVACEWPGFVLAAGALDRCQPGRARPHPPGAGLGPAGRSAVRPDVLRRARAAPCAPDRAAALGRRRTRGGFLERVRRVLRCPPSDHAAVVALLHGH